jgi:hypothetical protein
MPPTIRAVPGVCVCDVSPLGHSKREAPWSVTTGPSSSSEPGIRYLLTRPRSHTRPGAAPCLRRRLSSSRLPLQGWREPLVVAGPACVGLTT